MGLVKTKKFLSLLASCCILLSLFSCVQLTAYADELSTGYYGYEYSYGVIDHQNISYTFDKNTGTLAFTGEGEMYRLSSGTSPFFNHPEIKTVIIGEGITTVGDSAFIACSGLSTVIFPSTLSSIGSNSFRNCKSLESVEFPSNLQYINANSFNGCTGLTEIELPDSVLYIGEAAFYGTSIKTVSIGSNISVITKNPFSGCSLLEKITVDKNNPYYYSGSYNAIIEKGSGNLISGCKNTKIPFSVARICEYAFSGCSGMSSITIPNSVSIIEQNAFSGCSGLKSINIPKNVEIIGNSILSGCEKLEKITVDSNNKNYNSNNNCNAIIEHSSNKLIAGCKNSYIPETVTNIGVSAFYGCTGLKSIVIGKNVKYIYQTAFSNCSNLNDIYYTGSIIDWENIDGHEYLNNIIKHYNYVIPSISKATVSGIKNKTYSGGSITQSITVKYKNSTLKNGKDYYIEYKNNKNVGTATVTIKGIGKYTGVLSKTFKINPRGTAISKLTGKSKAISIKWKKQATATTGYQIKLSTSKSFNNCQTINISKNSITGKTVTKLKAKKKYYVKIRTYKTVNGKKFYSSWSEVKGVKTK